MTASADRRSAAQPPTPVAVELPIALGQFLKLAGLAHTGGEAKQLVTSGLVFVNGRIEERRGHKLGQGDVVESRGVVVRAVTPQRCFPGDQEGDGRSLEDRPDLHQDGSVPDARPPTGS